MPFIRFNKIIRREERHVEFNAEILARAECKSFRRPVSDIPSVVEQSPFEVALHNCYQLHCPYEVHTVRGKNFVLNGISGMNIDEGGFSSREQRNIVSQEYVRGRRCLLFGQH